MLLVVEQLIFEPVGGAAAEEARPVPDWLARGDIFLNTTHVDNTPISVLEAMACGLPVLLTGMPAGLPVDFDLLARDLARRQHGYGRGRRMQIEKDTAQVTGGGATQPLLACELASQIESLGASLASGGGLESSSVTLSAMPDKSSPRRTVLTLRSIMPSSSRARR